MLTFDRTLSAEKFKSLRDKHNFTQGQLALLLGVTQPAIAYYEKKGVKNFWIVYRLALTLDCKVSDLI